MAVNFESAHFPKEVILTCGHVEEPMRERGVTVDHATVNRWVVKYRPQLETAFVQSERRGMRQRMYMTLLCFGLACSSMACAPKLVGPTAPGGYFFTLQVTQPTIFVGPVETSQAQRYPDATEVIVRVQNAQGQPVDGVPVVFEVEPEWARLVSLSPSQATTRNGTARASLFEPQTTGLAHVMVRVDHTIQQATILIRKLGGRGGGDGE
jgi:hypothetical protein